MTLSADFSLPILLPPGISPWLDRAGTFTSVTLSVLGRPAAIHFSVEKPYLRGARTRTHAGRRMNLPPVLIELHGQAP